MSDATVLDDPIVETTVDETIVDTEQKAKTKRGFFSSIWKKITNGIKRAAEAVANAISTVWDFIKNPDPKQMEKLKAAAQRHPVLTKIAMVVVGAVVAVAGAALATSALAAAIPAAGLAWIQAHTVAASIVAGLAGLAVSPVVVFVETRAIAYLVPAIVKFAESASVYVNKAVKFVTDGITFVMGLVSEAFTIVMLGISLAMNAIALAILWAMTLIHKIVWGISLILQTPGLALQSMDALKTDWWAYLNSWKPKNFHCSTMADVILQEMRDDSRSILRLNYEQKRGPQDAKGHPTPKQQKRRKPMPIITPTSQFSAA